MKKAIDIVYEILIVVLIIIAGLSALTVISLPKNTKLLVVQSGSMEPTIKTKSLILVIQRNSYKVGDIITFKSKANVDLRNPEALITHRLVNIKNNNYITKGDANKAQDMELRSKEQIIGKAIINIPYIGYPISFAKTQIGFILLIVIPATLIIYEELMKVKNEVIKLMDKKKK